MIVVRVELWSAITGKKTEIARMHISNTGAGSNRRCDYTGESFVGRDSTAPRLDLHVWNLVTRMLTSMGYTR